PRGQVRSLRQQGDDRIDGGQGSAQVDRGHVATLISGSLGRMDLLLSPLHARHEDLGAKFSEFGGWNMPLEYADGGVLAEHRAVREAVGIFDVSHLGKVVVRGTGAADFVDRCLTNDLGRIAPGQAQYTLCCDEDGGTIDDLIVYLRSDFDVFLVPNAANTAEVVRRLAEAAPEGVEVVDRHRDHAIFAVQGPLSDETLAAAGLPTDHAYMSFTTGTVAGVEVTVRSEARRVGTGGASGV